MRSRTIMDRTELALVVILTILKLTVAADPPGGYYQTKYEVLDVEEILNNKRLVIHYVNCLLDRGACPPQGAELKRILPEALETNCLRCTDKQKEVIVRTVRRLRTEYPILWSELVSEYDPEGIYFVRFVTALDPTVQVEDQSNMLSNRFGDENFPIDLFPTSPKPTPPSTTTRKSRRTFQTFKTTRPTSTSTTDSRMTKTEEESVLLSIFTTPLPLFNRFDNNGTTATNATTTKLYPPTQTTKKPSPSSFTSKPSSSQKPLVFGWRPIIQGLRPQASRPPTPLEQSSINLLSSLGEIGTRVIEAGTQVAGMVLNAFVGNQ